MGFNFICNIAFIIEVDHTGVVFEYGNQPINFSGDLFGTVFDKGFVTGVDGLFFTGFAVFIINFSTENFVLTVFTPSLSKNFKLYVSWHSW